MAERDHPDVRASDLEREAAIEALRGAAGEGRLTFEELADRIEVADGATTCAELERLTADLPATAAVAEGAELTRRSTVLGDVRQAGRWIVPATSSWRSWLGDVVLDLREASVSLPEITIEARSAFGDVELLVPEGVVVEVRARTLFGDIQQEAGVAAPTGAPRVILTGGTVLGDVRVRAHRLRERLADRLLGLGARG